MLGRSPLAADRLLSFSPSRLHLVYFDRDLAVNGLWDGGGFWILVVWVGRRRDRGMVVVVLDFGGFGC